ncbi:hypothetical protein IFM89_036078 [Coptis chinensis]|uniref:HMA domain-containing protein n=1 Tax=Coptis chinensis TaxID=261450 RepID=A0A835M1P3_9MAGN|nr:hypothetical protein IFM89_036078 [Coptis chinensis]
MVPEIEKPRVTEIQVRMDCNGCVQKIKRALHGINGIYDLYIDFPQQKLTVVGWADPEKIVRAIKKTRKIATIYSHTTPNDSPTQPTEPAPEVAPPAPENPPPESAPAEAPPTEPPKDPPPPENPPPEATPPSDTGANQPPQPSGPKDVEEIHVIHHHHPNDYHHGSNGQWNNHPTGHGYWGNYRNGHVFRPEPPVYASHSYNTYKPSPYISEYEYVRSPPRQAHYSRMEHYSEDYHSRSNNGDGNNITSMFSDENPNACSII